MGAWLGGFRCTRSRGGACVSACFSRLCRSFRLPVPKASVPLSCCVLLKIRESQAFSVYRRIRTTEASAEKWSAAISIATRLTTGATPCFLCVNANPVPRSFSRVARTESFWSNLFADTSCACMCGCTRNKRTRRVRACAGALAKNQAQQTKRKSAAGHHLITCIRTQIADRDVRRRQHTRWRRLLQFLQGPFTCLDHMHYIAIFATFRPNMRRRVREIYLWSPHDAS